MKFITIRFAEEERSLKEEHRRKMDEYLQRKRHSMSASPVGNHRLSSSTSSATSPNIKAKLKQQQHNNFVTIPTTASAQVPYSSQPHVQYHHHYHNAGLTPEGENMERKVKQALMTELTTKPKPPSGKSDLSLSTRSIQRVDNSKLNPKNTATLHQGHQGSQGSPSISTWPGEDFHSGSNEMTPEPPNIPATNKPDISEFDPIETKNK